MYTIGEFASLGRVSVRMLRHYDTIGLLSPARVDPSSGYRFYDRGQLADLVRVIEFKDLGFTLEQVAVIVNDDPPAHELRALLAARRTELLHRRAADAERIDRLDARLRSLERNEPMSTSTAPVVVKPIEPRRLAVATAEAAGFESDLISPVIQPLYLRLAEALVAAGVPFTDPAVAFYEQLGDGVRISAGFTLAGRPEAPGSTADAAAPATEATDAAATDAAASGFAVTELPGAADAATLVHHGAMASIDESWRALGEWVEQNGYRATGLFREVYLQSMPLPQDEWVTELQMPVERA